MSGPITKKTIHRGEIAAILSFLAVIVATIVEFALEKSVTRDLIELIIYLFTCLTYLVFLLAVRATINSVGDSVFNQRMRDFFVAVIVNGCLTVPLVLPSLMPDALTTVFGLLWIISLAILGIVSIRIAPCFNKLDGNRALYGTKVARWLKISGWLMATVILSFVGIFVSVIADFYMWRLLKNERLTTTK